MSVRIKLPLRTPKGWKLAEKVGFQFLKLELRIAETHSKIRALTSEKEFVLDFFRSRLTTTDFEYLLTLVQELQRIAGLKLSIQRNFLPLPRSQISHSQMT